MHKPLTLISDSLYIQAVYIYKLSRHVKNKKVQLKQG